jgi:drug/metabolite transporter (DMT)-like permease
MGALLALASSGMWGTADFLAGELSRRRAALAVAGAAQIVGLGVMILVVLATGAWIDPPAFGSYAGWALLASLTGLGGLVAFYTALASGRMGIVSPIAALGVLVPLAAGLLSGEQPGAVQMVGILFAVVGVVLASGPEISGGAGLRPVLLAGVAALMFGLFFVFAARGSASDAVLTTTVQRACSTVLVLLMALVARSIGGLQRGDSGRLVVIGLFDVGANLTFGLASTLGLLAVVSVLGSVYPVVTVLLAWWVLKERLMPAQYAGVAAALVGVACIAGGGG